MACSFFFFDWLKSRSDLQLQWESGVVLSCGRLIMILVPLICVITASNRIYRPAGCIMLLVKCCISVEDTSTPALQAADWQIESYHGTHSEMRGLCSQHIPSFCWKMILQAFLCQCTAHDGELHEDRFRHTILQMWVEALFLVPVNQLLNSQPAACNHTKSVVFLTGSCVIGLDSYFGACCTVFRLPGVCT